MENGKKYCFTNDKSEDIYLFALRNNKNTEVWISNYGAIINSFKVVDGNGEQIDIVLGFTDMESYLDPAYKKRYPYFGAAVGRYANRISGPSFTIDGNRYELDSKQEGFQLHGGQEGFDSKVWEIINFDEVENSCLEMQYVSKDGEEGFPGNLTVNIRFELSAYNELSYTYTATTDKSTAINLSHHSYFNLHNGEDNILDHTLSIHASSILEQDKNRVATGEVVAVADTSFDFLNPTMISEKMDSENGIDHSYIIDKKDGDMGLAATLFSSKNNLQLEVWTSDPVVHFYAGQGIPPLQGKNRITYGDYSGLCLETQVHPNAINIPHFPNTVLKPGETYFQKTIYKILLPEK